MGKLKQPLRPEPVIFSEMVTVAGDDLERTGTRTVMDTALMLWESKNGIRVNGEAGQVQLRDGYVFEGWVKPYMPKTGTILTFNGMDLTVQSTKYLDAQKRRYQITALQQASNGQ